MQLPLNLVLAFALSSPAMVWAANAHNAQEPHEHHGHEAHSPATGHKLQLNAGKKWATDEALRQGMGAIYVAVSQVLPRAHSGQATAADFDAFAQEVNTQVAFIVQNCKLDPKADAQLHLIVADITSGTDAAQGKRGEKGRSAGVVQVAKAANAYGKYFDHADWKSIKLSGSGKH